MYKRSTRSRHMATKAPDVRLLTDFQICLIVGSVFSQMARLHHFSPFSLPSSVAQSISRQSGLADLRVLLLPVTLLMNKIEIAEARLLMGVGFQKRSFSRELVRRRDCIVTRTGDFSGPVFGKLTFAQLE